MKTIVCLTITFLCFNILFAQVPQSISYQAVVRDAQGNIVANQNVAFRFSIIQQSINGNTVYSERQTTTTNSLGMVNLAIGAGQVLTGNFDNIAWSQYPHFLKVELDVQGGTNYVNMGTTQLLSVPYALVANRSISDTLWVASGNDIRNTNPGRVGIGINNPTGKVTIQGDTSNVLFEVRDKDGNPVFVVYQDSVHVFVSNASSKTNKGTFAVSSKAQTKAGANTVFRIVPDSIVEIRDAQGLPIFRAFQDSVYVYVDATSSKTNKGTFAVSSKAQTKNNTQYLRITPDSSRVYTEDPDAGFGVRDLSSGSPTSYMTLTPENYFIGHESGENVSSVARFNVSVGYQAGKNIYTGKNNILLGFKSGYNLTSGSSNIYIGSNTGEASAASRFNVFIGDSAGYNSPFQEGSIFIGYKSGMNAGSQYNTFLGAHTGKNAQGVGNTLIGNRAGYNLTSGYFNTFVGLQAGENTTTGYQNVYIGTGAGNNSTTGNQNTCIGYGATVNELVSSVHNSTTIGYLAEISTSNTVKLGNSAVTAIGGAVNWTIISDKNIKTNIRDNVPGLEFIKRLRPVTYNIDVEKLAEITLENYTIDKNGKLVKRDIPDEIIQARREKSKIIYSGFIAQEVAQAAKEINYDFSGVKYPQHQHDLYSLSYAEFVVPLTKAVQELSEIVEKQQKEIEQLKKQIQELKK